LSCSAYVGSSAICTAVFQLGFILTMQYSLNLEVLTSEKALERPKRGYQMRPISVFALALMAFIGVPASADVDAGMAAYATCTACHGANGEGNAAMNAPRLTYLEPVYIVAQLQKFKAGIRGGADASATAQQMAGMAATLADDDAIMNVAAYIDTLDAPANAPTLSGDAANGADHYNQFCGACHGAAADGNVALNSPRLAGGDDWYLLAQLQAFKAGTRGAHPEDKTGRQMRAMAALLADEKTMQDVVAFISSIEK
jgi:cytochrome c553